MNISAIKAAAEKAGGREWFVDSKPTASGLAKVDDGTNGMFAIKAEWPEAQFIALANPSAILSLIERVTELEASVRSAIDLVESDVIRVRPSDFMPLSDALTRWHAALSNHTETVK